MSNDINRTLVTVSFDVVVMHEDQSGLDAAIKSLIRDANVGQMGCSEDYKCWYATKSLKGTAKAVSKGGTR